MTVKVTLISGVVVMLIGGAVGAVLGLWWVNASSEAICQRLLEDCGEQAMPMQDCLQGRQDALIRHGLAATRRVRSCISEAPRDCLSVTACIAAADD